MSSSERFARRLFTVCGIYGLIALLPQYFMEQRLGQDFPPAITHPEHFYGFLGVALAWQIAFLIMAREPLRYRPLILPAVLEKLGFGLAALTLFALQRAPALVALGGAVDLLMAALFALAYWRLGSSNSARTERT
ncbi:hypothetical protein RQP53_15835 [Paucibacter sp. APW11]|uniref:Uncharacterized protein n=1 Tax=Roseateles aquae TaxID=3077235 RepID=A0ABU3PEN2_9BURK|nr:hypothetical protein [Paucibacter sp. APW11]MDT9000747.1 hypothetical protein [Paucibacter sp. APW11]